MDTEESLKISQKVSAGLKEFGKRLRDKRGFYTSLEIAAQESGVSPATISRVERGAMVSIDNFVKLVKWLDPDSVEEVLSFIGIDY